MVKGHGAYLKDHPNVQSMIDSSIYFAKFQLKEPSDGSSTLKLGNWEEILPDEEKDAGVVPARSVDDYDEGLYCKELAKPNECNSNIRLAVINVGNWPIVMYTNFVGKYNV